MTIKIEDNTLTKVTESQYALDKRWGKETVRSSTLNQKIKTVRSSTLHHKVKKQKKVWSSTPHHKVS